MKSHASMNRIYRLVFNAALGIWVAVAENARGKGKGGRAASALVAVLAVTSPAAHAANAGDASVVGGVGSVSTVGNSTTINQTSQRLAIDWTKLSTAAGELLNFTQPNFQAIALNRITGSSPSIFLGSLTANGQVFILNPNGVLFGAGSQVNVGGMVASTLDMNPTNFMNGSNTFTKTTGTASVVNQGSLTALGSGSGGGYLALLAPEVRNEGVITATLGTVFLAAGNKVTLNLNNGSLLGYSIDEKAIGALVENKQLIKVDGGQVILSARAADAVSSGVVNNTGIIEAKSLTSVGGKILLEGDLIIQNGTLNASGASGGSINIAAKTIIDAGTGSASGTTGSGGNVTYNTTQAIVQTASANLAANGATTAGHISLSSANNLFTSGTLSATGQHGGTVDLLGSRVVLAAAAVDASGTASGGLIRAGGDFKGANPNVANAQTTLVNGATTLKANGANGKVVVWSNEKTDFYGSIIATGNATKGGEAEVSSKGTLTYGGNASLGVGGSLLLDPANIIIDDAAGPAAFALQDPNSFAGKQFGSNLKVLGTTANGVFTPGSRVVVAAENDNLGGDNSGAAYLFNTTTGALISTLVGSAASDKVGLSVLALTNGNYVVRSGNWNGTRGAATWGSGTAGITGAVSAANSLVGSTAGDYVGAYANALTNGNYVVHTGIFGVFTGATAGQVLIGTPGNIGFDTGSGQTMRFNPSGISATLAGGTAVTLQASNDITVNSNITVAGTTGGALTLQAGRSIALNANISSANGNINLIANDTAASGVVSAQRSAGAGSITMANGTTLDAGTGNVNITLRDGAGITNTGVGNITLATVKAAQLTIDAVALAAGVTVDPTKVYDGSRSISGVAASVTGLGFTASSNLTLAPVAASYDTKDAGSNKTVTATGFGVSGVGVTTINLRKAGAALQTTASTTATIAQRQVSVAGMAATGRQYDGTTAAALTGGSITTGVAGEALSFSGQSGTFASANAGSRAVTVTGTTLGDGAGGQASNYVLTGQPAVAAATIAQKALTVTANNDSRSVRNAAYAGGNGVLFNGFVVGDGVANLSGALAYGGTAQGARAPGNYSIAAGGLSSGNYDMRFVDGTLTIVPLDTSYGAALQSIRLDDTAKRRGLGFEKSPTQIEGCGVLMPAGFNKAECN